MKELIFNGMDFDLRLAATDVSTLDEQSSYRATFLDEGEVVAAVTVKKHARDYDRFKSAVEMWRLAK